MSKLRRIIIAGGRDFNDSQLLLNSMWPLLKGDHVVEIISGGASGADKLGECFAKSYDLPITRFPADWSKHGKSAGPIRNLQMAEYADELVAFWDGKSRGTKNMIDTATKLNLKVHVVLYNQHLTETN